MNIPFKKYVKEIFVEAVEYYEGLETGFDIRYYDDEDVEEDGTIHTSGLIVKKHKIKVPFFKGKGQCRVLLGEGYYLIRNSKGIYSKMYKDKFLKTFRKI